MAMEYKSSTTYICDWCGKAQNGQTDYDKVFENWFLCSGIGAGLFFRSDKVYHACPDCWNRILGATPLKK